MDRESKRSSSAIYCQACDYDLQHTTGVKCPECGRGFDRNNPSSTRLCPRNWYEKRLWDSWESRGMGIGLLVATVAAVLASSVHASIRVIGEAMSISQVILNEVAIAWGIEFPRIILIVSHYLFFAMVGAGIGWIIEKLVDRNAA